MPPLFRLCNVKTNRRLSAFTSHQRTAFDRSRLTLSICIIGRLSIAQTMLLAPHVVRGLSDSARVRSAVAVIQRAYCVFNFKEKQRKYCNFIVLFRFCRWKAACLPGMRQRFQYVQLIEHTSTHPFGGEAASMSSLWQTLHRQLEPLLSSNDTY